MIQAKHSQSPRELNGKNRYYTAGKKFGFGHKTEDTQANRSISQERSQYGTPGK